MKKRLLALLSALSLCLLVACAPTAPTGSTPPAATPSQAAGVADGDYEGSGQGNNGPITVSLTMKNGAIAAIQIKDHAETAGIADKALSDLPAAIVEHQSVKIDTVAGATNSSKGVIEAVTAALTAAGADMAAFSKSVAAAPVEGVSDTTADAVVIGAGGAGMTAAIRLKEAGKNVILLEKQDIAGGATNLAATYFVAVDTDVQKDAGETTTIEDYIAASLKQDPNLNADNLRTLLTSSQASVDWLRGLGVELTKSLSYYQVGLADSSSLGVAIAAALQKEVANQGVDLRLGHKATGLTTNADGSISGVTVETAGGKYTIGTESVLLATGGFAANEELVKKYAPNWAGTTTTTAAGNTGDGVDMALSAGAALGYMDVVRMNPSVYSDGTNALSMSVCRQAGGIMVNMAGNRFCNDYFKDYTQLSKWMMEQEGDHVYVVFDQASVDSSKRIQGFEAQGCFLKSDTVEGLAEQMNVPAETLKATLEKYAKVYDTKVDEEFGRDTAINSRLDKAPYYAVVCKPGIQVTLGGINVDSDMQVLREDGSVIPGLYAAGECANDGLFGGGPTNINVTFGTIAAQNMVERLNK